MGLFSKAKNLVLGKKVTDPGDKIATSSRSLRDQNTLGSLEAIIDLRKQMKQDPGGIIRAQTNRQLSGLRQGAEDQRRVSQGALARRGLQGSAAGVFAEIAPQRDLANKQASLQASIPERIANLRTQRANNFLSAGAKAASFNQLPSVNFGGTSRRGGLLGKGGLVGSVLGPLAPALPAIGAALGGPAGAAIGGAAGSLGKSRQ